MKKVVKRLWKWKEQGESYGPCLILTEDGKSYTGTSKPEGLTDIKSLTGIKAETVEDFVQKAVGIIEIKLKQEVTIIIPEEETNLDKVLSNPPDKHHGRGRWFTKQS